MPQRASHTPVELPLNHPKPSRKTTKNSQKNANETHKQRVELNDTDEPAETGDITWSLLSQGCKRYRTLRSQRETKQTKRAIKSNLFKVWMDGCTFGWRMEEEVKEG